MVWKKTKTTHITNRTIQLGNSVSLQPDTLTYLVSPYVKYTSFSYRLKGLDPLQILYRYHYNLILTTYCLYIKIIKILQAKPSTLKFIGNSTPQVKSYSNIIKFL